MESLPWSGSSLEGQSKVSAVWSIARTCRPSSAQVWPCAPVGRRALLYFSRNCGSPIVGARACSAPSSENSPRPSRLRAETDLPPWLRRLFRGLPCVAAAPVTLPLRSPHTVTPVDVLPAPTRPHPLTWGDPSVPGWVSNTALLGGFSGSHVTPQVIQLFNFPGLTPAVHLCLSPRGSHGCLRGRRENQTAFGGGRADPRDLNKLIQTIRKWGFSNDTPGAHHSRPPLPLCSSETDLEPQGLPLAASASVPTQRCHPGPPGVCPVPTCWPRTCASSFCRRRFCWQCLHQPGASTSPDLRRLVAATHHVNFTNPGTADLWLLFA